MVATLLPDDAVRKILLRVSTTDVAALFRCTFTCKQWRTLITDWSFLRLRWPENMCDPSLLLGFFGHRYDMNQPPSLNPISSGSVLGPLLRPLSSFIFGTSDGVLLLAARCCLLLVHVRR